MFSRRRKDLRWLLRGRLTFGEKLGERFHTRYEVGQSGGMGERKMEGSFAEEPGAPLSLRCKVF